MLDHTAEAQPASSESDGGIFPLSLALISLCFLTTQAFYFAASPSSLSTFLNSQHLLSLSTPAYSPVKCHSPLSWIFLFFRVDFFPSNFHFSERN